MVYLLDYKFSRLLLVIFYQTLREALSSKNNFQKHYFELAELAIGTFKHMKHYRAARSIGSDLAEFYM